MVRKDPKNPYTHKPRASTVEKYQQKAEQLLMRERGSGKLNPLRIKFLAKCKRTGVTPTDENFAKFVQYMGSRRGQ
ncbi:MAG: hypothetical protein WCW13_04815 [archaeon]